MVTLFTNETNKQINKLSHINLFEGNNGSLLPSNRIYFLIAVAVILSTPMAGDNARKAAIHLEDQCSAM